MNNQVQAWLEMQCRLLSGVANAIVLMNEARDGRFTPVAAWPVTDEVPAGLGTVARTAAAQRKCVVKGERIGEADRSDFIGFPLLFDGQLAGVLAIELRGRPEAERRSVIKVLKSGSPWLEFLLRQGGAASGESLLDVSRLFARCLAHDGFEDAATALATDLAQRFTAARVSIGTGSRKSVALAAVSHSARHDQRTNLAAMLEAAMLEALAEAAMVRVPDHSAPLQPAHATLIRATGEGSVISCPLRHADDVFGCITLERSAQRPFTDAECELIKQVTALAGPVLELKQHKAKPLARTVADKSAGMLKRLTGHGHAATKLVTGSLLAIVLFLGLVDGPYRVKADATLEGSIQRVVVAPIEGYVASAAVRAGETVAEGDLLATLDDRDLKLEQVKWSTEFERFSKEYREALAEHDRAKTAVLQAQLRQAEAQLDLIEAQLARTRVVAPFAGLVIDGDLSQSLGAPVERGSVLFKIAPLSGYRVVLEVDETDVAEVAAGQKGRLSLASLPRRTFPITVEQVTPVAEAADGHNRFRVEARLDEGAEKLRPGMEGVGKIAIGERRYGWLLTHRLVEWLTLKLWALSL